MNNINHSEISDYLSALAADDAPVIYCPNPGNGGDALIAASTFQLFERSGLSYNAYHWSEVLSLELDWSKHVFVYGGGGAFVNEYQGAPRILIEALHKRVKKLVILPHTINTHADVLSELGSNVEIICREQTSFEYVRASAPKANVFLMEDLGLSLDVEDVFKRGRSMLMPILFGGVDGQMRSSNKSHTSSANFVKKLLKVGAFEFLLGIKYLFRGKAKEVNCFRNDGEKTNIQGGANNYDISELFMFGHSCQKTALYTTYRFMRFIDRYDVINTNRLHVAIGAALLGKRVKFYPNSYYKCQAVYDYSIKDNYANVEWCWPSGVIEKKGL